MSGVLDVTLQRSAQWRRWGWWAHSVKGLAEDERGHSGNSGEEDF